MKRSATEFGPHDRSPFTGQLVPQLANLAMPPSARPPVFDEDRWDFTGLRDAPVQLKPSELLFDFVAISNTSWRLVAKELMIAMLCPRHPALLELPNVRRSALHLRTCHQRLFSVTKWFEWLTDQGVRSLGQVTQQHCDRYFQQRDSEGLSAASLMHLVTGTKEVAHYGALFTADRYRPGFVPWQDKPSAAVAAFTSRGENKTQAVADSVLGPVVRSGLYLVNVLGPHLPGLLHRIETRRARPRVTRHVCRREFSDLMDHYIEQHQPLPEIDDRYIARRLKQGWSPEDPLLRVSFMVLCRDLGLGQLYAEDLPQIRDLAEHAVSRVGVLPMWAREAPEVATADDAGTVAWTPPMTTRQVMDFTITVFNACLVLTAAVSGMRASELMELTPASVLAPREVQPGLFRFGLSSKRIKNEQWGGVEDEWVVIESAHRAVELATRLSVAKNSGTDDSVFGRFSFVKRFNTLRRAGQRPDAPTYPGSGIGTSTLRCAGRKSSSETYFSSDH